MSIIESIMPVSLANLVLYLSKTLFHQTDVNTSNYNTCQFKAFAYRQMMSSIVYVPSDGDGESRIEEEIGEELKTGRHTRWC